MPYARVCDQEWMDPRVTLVGLAAYGALNRMRGYCAAYQTDGYLPRDIALVCAGGELDLLERLERGAYIELVPDAGIRAGINGGGQDDRVADPGGLVKIADWLDHNMSKAEWEAEQARRSSSGRKAAKARWANRNGGQNSAS